MKILNRYRPFLSAAFLAVATVHSGTAQAEDIDLFRYNLDSGAPPPNVLFMVDNSANWNQNIGSTEKRVMIHQALESVFSDGELENTMGVGFMLFSHGNSPKGGTVVEHVELLDGSYRNRLLDIFRENSAPQDPEGSGLQQGNNAPYALSFHEARQYYGGRSVRSGLQNDDVPHDPDAISGNDYVSPSTDVCRNFAILVASGDPDSGENREAEDELGELGGILSNDPISLDPSSFESNWSDEYARFLNSIDVVPEDIAEGEQQLTTYVIDVFDPDVNRNRPFQASRAFLKSIANQGGGSYFEAHNEEDIKLAVEDALTEIKAVNSVFAATALPVSVNVRGTNLNQVYIGVFRPDAQDRPRWFGNLKLYQLAVDESTDEVFLADADGDQAQSATTGFIRPSATSFWTHASTFWDFSPRGEPPSASDVPDGEVVEKGGAAQKLRDLEDSGDYREKRNIFTCTAGCEPGDSLSDTPFSAVNGNIPLDDDLIAWVRGEDNAGGLIDTLLSAGGEDDDNRNNDVRASVHGDVLHSQPSIVNYGTGGDEDVVAFYGANDGMIHAVRGGKDSDSGGQELWSFVPPEFFDKLEDLRSNPASAGKTYFADGSLSSYVLDNDGDGIVEPGNGDRIYLYTSMRRGGRFLYALDVTDKEDPKLLWHIDSDTAGFAELGQSWSDPNVGRIQGMDDPVVFFGAGYDPEAEDGTPDDSDSATQGRGLFAVNGLTGAPIWQVGPSPDGEGGGTTVTQSDMDYSMPAGPTLIDRDRDGYLDRIYIPDTGGQIWRVNLTGDDDTGQWEVYKLADVGSDQEFQHPVDVVASENTNLEDPYDAVLIGSGDRENPFDTGTTNRFYMFKDRGNPDDTITFGELFNATENIIQDGNEEESEDAITTLADSKGWYITLENAGEKVVGGATTLSGTTYFNTNQPPGESVACTANLGIARNYAVSFKDATATTEQGGEADLTVSDRSKTLPGGGFPPSPVPIMVLIGDKPYLAVCSGTNCEGSPANLGVRERVFWNRENLDQ